MTRYALVIGIGNYEKISPNLPKAATDAEAIAQLLEKQGNFQEVQRLPKRWIKDEKRWEVAQDKKLTGKDLGEALKIFLQEKAKHKDALIYFAGHGLEIPNWNGKKKGYLATSDCTSEGRNGILLDDLNELIGESELSNLVVLLDCCHAGYALERKQLDDSLIAFGKKTDYYLITACRPFEKALEAIEHGVFTGAVLKGLGAENADEDGRVSGDRLFDFITSELKGSSQEPIRMGWGRSITLVQYQPKNTDAIIDETCPYQGLQAFSKEQARFFFGREKTLHLLLEKLGEANFVPIIGASGSGKSSVVRAGLILALEKNGWQVLEAILPGVEPLAELKRTFTQLFERSQLPEIYSVIETTGLPAVIERLPGSKRLLLVVDQFEEVFTVCFKEEERRRFIELLAQVAEIPHLRLAIVTTMRADFLEPCLSYESLTRLIQSQAVYMPPLLGAELEEAIAKPANLQGYHLETGLLGAILDDVGKEKDCLPLLQFALTELWEKRNNQKHHLTLEQYRALGGVTGALNRHAQKVYTYKDFHKDSPQQKRTPQEQEWIKWIFLRLVRTGEGEKDTRQRQPKAKLLDIAKNNLVAGQVINNVLDELIQGRLLVSGQDNQQQEAWVDLAHEALMEGWQQFVQWRQENRELRRLIDRAEDALREWQKQPKDENLMMGGLLAQVREKWQELELKLDRIAIEFYYQSHAYETQHKKQIAQFQAFTEADLQDQTEKVLSLLNEKPVEALVLSIKATGLSLERLEKVLPDVEESLRQAVEISREQNILELANDEEKFMTRKKLSSNFLIFTQDSKYIISLVSSGTGKKTIVYSPKAIRKWDRQGNLIIEKKLLWEQNYSCIAISPDSEHIAFGRGNTVNLGTYDRKQVPICFRGHQEEVSCIAFSPDGHLILSGSRGGELLLWDLQGHPLMSFNQINKKMVNHVSFRADGKSIISCSDARIKLWDIQGKPISKDLLDTNNFILPIFAYSPDGEYIISGNTNGDLLLLDQQGELIFKFTNVHQKAICSIAFSPNGDCVASASEGTIRLWDMQPSQDSDWESLFQMACNRLRYHPVFKNPQTEEAKAACEVCQKYVWACSGHSDLLSSM